MANDYLNTKIKDAITQSKNNPSMAAKLLIEWSLDDQALLLSLCHKQLPSLAVDAVETVLESLPQNKNKKPKPIDVPVESFGKDLLEALSGKDAVRFGMEGAVGRPIETKRKKASQEHIDILKKMSTYKPDDKTESR